MDEDGNPKKPGPPPKTEGESLELGAFTVTPPTGTIDPGENVTITVVFAAENDRKFTELAGIDVTDRDPSDQPLGIPYEIAGESCIPGIDCEDVGNIFEEHKIVSALEPFSPEGCVFAKRDKVFSFGAVIARAAAEPPDGGDDPERPPETDAEFTKRGGVVASFKMSNPNKVQCTVDFTVKPRGDDATQEGSTFPITISPETLEIPPH